MPLGEDVLFIEISPSQDIDLKKHGAAKTKMLFSWIQPVQITIQELSFWTLGLKMWI